jgi:flagellar biosynthesis/type III secretory pathway M-ring protein FliF/YscJ
MAMNMAHTILRAYTNILHPPAGLRKFRRQMTIEEQIQKAETEENEVEPDELDDIDKVRDDLQSTKQMLALELRNKEAMERENKKLLVKLSKHMQFTFRRPGAGPILIRLLGLIPWGCTM